MKNPGSQPEVQVKIKILNPLLKEHPPAYSTPDAAGIDLRACMDQDEIVLTPGERHAFASGLAIEITSPAIAGFVFSRSGLGTKEGLTVSQGVGVIDPDYRGQIMVSLLNTSKETRSVKKGQRIAQLVFMPICQAEILPVEELNQTLRGQGGFGHTGKI